VPLVLDLHGLIEDGPIHAAHTQMGAYGDQQGFVTLTPDSGREPDQWELTGTRDVAFMADLLDQAEADLCIDRNRVYATGLSMGGLMTTVLACELADRIAAAAPVAGVGVPPGCEPSRPVPAVIVHGTDDPILAYDGGLGAGAASLPLPGSSGASLGDMDEAEAAAVDDFLPGAEPSAAAWAERNGCDTGVTEEEVADDVRRLTYACPADAAVELYAVDGGGHTWPGSDFDESITAIVGHVTRSISANEIMWAFFQDHPR
jgi:polyhydroxybutyrate depolymerase